MTDWWRPVVGWRISEETGLRKLPFFFFFISSSSSAAARSHAVRWHGRPFIHNRCVGVHGAVDAKGVGAGQRQWQAFLWQCFLRLERSLQISRDAVYISHANVAAGDDDAILFGPTFEAEWTPSLVLVGFKFPLANVRHVFLLNRSGGKQTFYYLSEQWQQRRLKIIIKIHIYKPLTSPLSHWASSEQEQLINMSAYCS